ncbi:MAG TPA: pirin family protein [Nocardioidaceae bacterium]|jgi:quercetin 2,3-dioxygenase|nr:pirin family protein [Nocardioidaceae bacterium]
MIDGVFRHQDSNGGGGGLITDGDTQWMTAGAGLSLALITLLTTPRDCWNTLSAGRFGWFQAVLSRGLRRHLIDTPRCATLTAGPLATF